MKPAAPDADDQLAMDQPTAPPPRPRATTAGAGATGGRPRAGVTGGGAWAGVAGGGAWAGVAASRGPVDNPARSGSASATLPHRGPGRERRVLACPDPNRRSPVSPNPDWRVRHVRRRVAVVLVAWLLLAGCVSVRPLHLVRRTGWRRRRGAGRQGAGAGGAARARGPDGGAAGQGQPVDALAMVDTALVPEVLGQPEETARRLLDQAGLTTEVQTGCDTDAPAPPPSPAGSGAPGRARGARPPPEAGSACGSTPGVPSSHHNDPRARPTPTSMPSGRKPRSVRPVRQARHAPRPWHRRSGRR